MEGFIAEQRLATQLLENKSLPKESVKALLEKKAFRRFSGSRVEYSGVPDAAVISLLRHPSLLPEEIQEMANDREELDLLFAIAASPLAPLPLLEKFAKGRRNALKIGLLHNPELPKSIRNKLLRAKSDAVRMEAAKTFGDLAADDFSESSDPNVRGELAADSQTSKSILLKLSSDGERLVREAVLDNPNVPKAAVKALLNDTEDTISITAMFHEKINRADLLELVQSDVEIRRLWAEVLSIPARQIKGFLDYPVDSGRLVFCKTSFLSNFGLDFDSDIGSHRFKVKPGSYRIIFFSKNTYTSPPEICQWRISLKKTEECYVGDPCYVIKEWEELLDETDYLEFIPRDEGIVLQTGGDGSFNAGVFMKRL